MSEDLKVLLEGKYSCKKVMVIEEGLDDKNSTYRWDLGKIRQWVENNHTSKEINDFYKKSRHKCGVLDKKDVKPDLIKYYGLEILTF